MSGYYDSLETRAPADREKALFEKLPVFLQEAAQNAPGLARWLHGIELASVNSREELAKLPVLRKSDLMELQRSEPPFGGFAFLEPGNGNRVFMSPGPIFEPQGVGPDPWLSARAFHAAGIRPGDIVHNAFAYNLTPGGFILDEGARAYGCTVFPAGTGNTEMQVEAAAALQPSAYCGTPDFLKIILDKADETGRELSCFKRALVSGGALFPSLRSEYKSRGINVLQCYATAECGVIAYETTDEDGTVLPGMLVNEDMIVEIVRPGTDDPVEDGEVGEVVVTTFNSSYPMIRLGTGDLSKTISGASPCGRTNMRIAGWMGRADQRTKIKGMFVDPKQVAQIVSDNPDILKARLVVFRDGENDAMKLLVEAGTEVDHGVIAQSLRNHTKLSGSVETVKTGSLPNDGKIIADDRDYAG